MSDVKSGDENPPSSSLEDLFDELILVPSTSAAKRAYFDNVTVADLGVDQVALIFGFLDHNEIMRARVCTTWRDAAKNTLVPSYNIEVKSVRSYKMMSVMSSALPSLQELSINDVGDGNKYSDGEDSDQNRSAQTATYTTHDINIISNFRKLRVLNINDYHSTWCGGLFNSLNGL